MTVSAVFGLLLSLANLVIWGCWPLIRMYCKADGPVFMILYLSGQWIVGLVFALIYNPMMFSDTLSIATTRQSYSSIKVACLLIGGHLAGHGDFLCASACTRIPVSIAFPIYTGLLLVLGISLTFIIENGEGSSPGLLFAGVFFALSAVCSLALADANSNEAIEKQRREQQTGMSPLQDVDLDEVEGNYRHDEDSTNHLQEDFSRGNDISNENQESKLHPLNSDFVTNSEHDDARHIAKGPRDRSVGADTETKTSDESTNQHHISDFVPSKEYLTIDQSLPSPKSEIFTLKGRFQEFSKSSRRIAQRVNGWVYVCVFAGFLTCGWSPISTIGRSSPGGIVDPASSLFLFLCGYFSALPLLLYYYGSFIIVLETRCNRVPIINYLKEVMNLPYKDKFFGCLAGGLVGLGYGLYFISSDIIAPTIALGIASCEPLATIIFGALFFGTLKGTTSLQRTFMVFSAISFIIAVTLMTLSSVF